MLDILNIKIVTQDEQDEIDRQMILIADIINSHFSNLTPSEIKEAFKLYVSKKFVDVKVFRLVDCVAVGEILNAYIEYRNAAVEPFLVKRQNLLNAPIEKSESEKQKIRTEFIEMVFNEIIEKGFCSDAWYIFKQLEDLKKIEISNEEKIELFKKEMAIYVPAERQRIIKQNPLDFKFKISGFEKTYQNGKKPIAVQNKCRSVLVSDYILKSKISLEELLTILK